MSPELFLGVLASLMTSRSSLTDELRSEEDVRVLIARFRVTEALRAGEAAAEATPPNVIDELTSPGGEAKLAFSLLRPEMEPEATL